MAIAVGRGRGGILMVLAAAVIGASAIGCMTDPGGHSYEAYNESDQVVIATLVTDWTRTVRIAARSRSSIESSFGEPTAARPWTARIFDASCRPIGTIDLIAGHRTIHITGLGAVELVDSDHWRPPEPLLPFASVESAEPCP